MFTSNAALSLDDISLLREGLQAAASAHRGPKSPLVLKKEAKRNALDAELKALQAVIISDMTGKPADAANHQPPAAKAPGKKAAPVPAAAS